MKKRLLSVLLCGCLAVSMLAGCGSKKEEEVVTNTDAADAAEDTAEEAASKVDYVFEKGWVTAEALAYVRGRSIANTYILVDEAQNSTPQQMLGILTRAGLNSKIVICGDPDQIDNPRVDRQNNGLVYAADRMKGSPTCAQITFSEEECVRSPLAKEAAKLLK